MLPVVLVGGVVVLGVAPAAGVEEPGALVGGAARTGGGVKKTTKSKLGALDEHPPTPEAEDTVVPAVEEADLTESARVTRVTPLIKRRREISRATSSWLAVQP